MHPPQPVCPLPEESTHVCFQNQALLCHGRRSRSDVTAPATSAVAATANTQAAAAGPARGDVRRQQLGRHRRRHQVERRLRQDRPDQRGPGQGAADGRDQRRPDQAGPTSWPSATASARATTSSSTTCTPPRTARRWSSPGRASPTSSSINLATGAIKWRFPVSGYRSDHMAVSPDGTRVAVSASTSNTVHVLNIDTGEQLGSFVPATSRTRTSSPTDGKYIWNMSIGDVNTSTGRPVAGLHEGRPEDHRRRRRPPSSRSR